MKNKYIYIAGALSALFFTQASLANTNNQAFSGFYAGAGVGENINSYQSGNSPQKAITRSFHGNNITPTIFIGYGHEFNDHIYIGIDAGFSYFMGPNENRYNLPGSKWGNFYVGITPKYQAFLDLTPGYAISNRFLVYGIIGAGLTGYNNSLGFYHSQYGQNVVTRLGRTPVASTNFYKTSNTNFGLRLGLGVKYKLTNHWALGISYVYSPRSHYSFTQFVGGSEPGNQTRNDSQSTQNIMASVSYYF